MTDLLPKPVGVLDAIYSRRAVRSYTPERLDESTVRTLLDAAIQAPTAVHLEPWAFVVVQDPKALKRYSDLAKETQRTTASSQYVSLPRWSATAFARYAEPDFDVFHGATTLIVICARPLGQYVAADCWLAAGTLMLAAAGLGLGTCPIGFAIPMLNRSEIKAELGIPPEAMAIAPIVVGVPAEKPEPVPRRPPEILCWKK